MTTRHILLLSYGLCLLVATDLYSQRIAAGGRHSIAICSDGSAQTWGYNGFGQLGNGNIDEQHSGTPVIGLNGIAQVAGGLFHSLFVRNDGTVWSCGRNTPGNLGNGTNENSNVPVQVTGLTDIVLAAGGGEHSLFLTRDGTVWACGNNSSGQLGDGTNISRNIPVPVGGLLDVIQIAAGAEYSLFLKSDGTVLACGHNGNGQFGTGANKSSNVPVKIVGLSNIVGISAGEWHSLFVDGKGLVFSCGRNQYGQLGDGTTVDNNTVSRVMTLSGIVQVEAGGIHSVFLKDDGTVWACGLNSGGNNDGQLGDGATVDKHIPVQVIPSWGNGTIVRVESTREHSLFQESKGTIWAAGRNNYGQLGYGTFTSKNSSTPVRSSAVCSASPTSVSVQNFKKADPQVVPNPTSGKFRLKSEGIIIRIEVIDIYGEIVCSLVINPLVETVEIDLTARASGTYFVRATDLNNRVTTSVVAKQ